MKILNLSTLTGMLDDSPAFRSLCSGLAKTGSALKTAATESARPFLIAALHRKMGIPILVISGHAENSRKLYEQLCIWDDPTSVKLLPEPDALPYERITSDSLTELDALKTLSALAKHENNHPLVVTSAHAFCIKQPSAAIFAQAFHEVKTGQTVNPESLMKRWQAMGYQTESIVEVPGTMGKRGGILDIYPPTSELPARIEFFGNYVESIRYYDPVDQRSVRQTDSVTIGPAEVLLPNIANIDPLQLLNTLDTTTCTEESVNRLTEDIKGLFEGRKISNREFYAPLFNQSSLLEYLPQNALVILDEPLIIERATEEFEEKALELRDDMVKEGTLPANFPVPYLTWNEQQQLMSNATRLSLSSFGGEEKETGIGLEAVPGYAGQLRSFLARVKELLTDKKRIIIVSHQATRLQELLQENDVFTAVLEEIRKIPPSGSLTLLQGLPDSGWQLDNKTFIFTDAEIFGFSKVQRFQKKRPIARHKLFADIRPGEYVVHIEHGIGEFIGFTTTKAAGSEREYLVLRYGGGDVLYVPTDQVDRVTRYMGAGEDKPNLSRLGTQEWNHTKQKVKEATEEVAKDLLDLYAGREVVKRNPYSHDTIWQHEIESSFPYVETPDQITVLQHVKEDMEKPKPMDRLVCGDVGYGKTEVAVRAAFKAVMDGKQVALLVPTTVLAQQHFLTFTQRMKAYPLRVEVISRFRTPKQQKEILEALAAGSVDIIIGTHRLVQKDVQFKNLGLLIIDEEQRFGVQHKEFLKKMRQEVDVLTLSATPIPRTLHMSLVGVRDMSTMDTPPEDRLPIKTYIAEYDDRLVREAILREIERSGQVFFVHNRVQTIELVANKIRTLVPEARVVVGHGQMGEDQLENVTSDFLQNKYDVLVCTTIIESGLDMPNVNTLIVNMADRFGLTQLYQLRGRVGRGATLAYAYFLFDKGKRITPVAEKRLQTIHEATELGAGFNIAMRDLEIRGAGTLLGTHQSGHISAVGFSLYSQMLSKAIENLKEQRAGLP
ncbi:MAG TPA: transcription-repair coupling factor, partial [Dehalococcoidales bacterium]|nr:transcription-repair coupling factor [Dehalococcoidales bacterium]